MLILPATPEVVAGFIAAAEAAPEELSTIANVMPCPPMPFVPEEQHGKLVVLAMLAYAGDTEAGQRALAPFRALATPLADMVKPMPYPEIYPPDDDEYHPLGDRADDVRRQDRSAASPRRSSSTSRPRTRRCASRSCGSSAGRWPACRPTRRPSPTGARRIMVNVASFYEGPEDKDQRASLGRRPRRGASAGRPAAPTSTSSVDEGEERIRAAYPGSTWDRLAAVKARYDPTNLFRLNQNIPRA